MRGMMGGMQGGDMYSMQSMGGMVPTMVMTPMGPMCMMAPMGSMGGSPMGGPMGGMGSMGGWGGMGGMGGMQGMSGMGGMPGWGGSMGMSYDHDSSSSRNGRREDCGDEIAEVNVPDTDPRHPCYRPAKMESVEGVTTKRFEGWINYWRDKEGWGFIKYTDPELLKRYPEQDVFLHKNQKRGFIKGDSVSFHIFINFRGKPQATEIRRAMKPTDDEI